MGANQAGCRLLAVVLIFACPPSYAAAQLGQDASLTGTITDDTGAVLAGAKLTTSSPQLIGGPRTTQSDANGFYRFQTLPPGSYTLIATQAGFEQVVRRDIELPVGLALTVDMRLRLSAIESRVDVEGLVPAIDVQSSASPTSIDRTILENLPAPLGRSITDVAELAPGITSGVAFGGPAFVMPVSADGTDLNDPVLGFPSPGPRINWTESIQIVSVGAPAEDRRKHQCPHQRRDPIGVEPLRRSRWYWTTGPRWTDSNRGSLPPGMFRPTEILEWRNAAAQLGGPAIRNRVWYFAGVDYYRFGYRPSSFTGPRPSNEPASSTREPRLLAKLSTAPTATMRLEGFVEHDNGRSLNDNVGLGVPPEAVSSSRYPSRAYNVRYTWQASDKTSVEAHYGGFHADRENGPASEEARNGPAPHYDQATRVNSVNVQSFGETKTRVNSAQFALTRHVDGLGAKSHDVKVGLEHERTRRTQSQRYPGDTLYLDRDGEPELVRFWAGATTRPSFHRTSAFVEDTWRLSERVTLEPGVRLSFYRSSLPDTTVRLYENHSLSPRLGAAWDLSRDHRTVVRAHYGHYNEGMFTALFDFLDRLADAPTIVARVTGPGQFEEVSRQSVTLSSTEFDRHAGHMYAEEYVAGIEREAMPRLSLRAQVHPQEHAKHARLHRHRLDMDACERLRSRTGRSWGNCGRRSADDGVLQLRSVGCPLRVDESPGRLPPIRRPAGRRRATIRVWLVAASVLHVGEDARELRQRCRQQCGHLGPGGQWQFRQPEPRDSEHGTDRLRSPARPEGVRNLCRARLGHPRQRRLSIHERRALCANRVVIRSRDADFHDLRRAGRHLRAAGAEQHRSAAREDIRYQPIRSHRALWRCLQRQQSGWAHEGQQHLGVRVRSAARVEESPAVPRRCAGHLLRRRPTKATVEGSARRRKAGPTRRW